MTEHPITPSPKLVHKWCEIWNESDDEDAALLDYILVRAAQWGADQELEACCELLTNEWGNGHGDRLHRLRRPKPLSLKKEALGGLDQLAVRLTEAGVAVDLDTIRRALEAIND